MPDAAVSFDWSQVESATVPAREHPATPLVLPTLRRLIESHRPRLELVALALAAGVPIHPDIQSQSDAAQACGVTRAAMSKRVRYWREHLGLRSVHMRSDEARQNCRAAQLRNHWRRRRAEAMGAGDAF